MLLSFFAADHHGLCSLRCDVRLDSSYTMDVNSGDGKREQGAIEYSEVKVRRGAGAKAWHRLLRSERRQHRVVT